MDHPFKRPLDPRVLDAVLDVVRDELLVSRIDIMSRSRRQPLAWHRQIAMHLVKRSSAADRVSIGRVFGGREHTTVRWAVNKVADMRSISPGDDALIHRLEAQVDRRLAPDPSPPAPPNSFPHPRSSAPSAVPHHD